MRRLLFGLILCSAVAQARPKQQWDQPVGNYEQAGFGEKSFMTAYPNLSLTPGDVRDGITRSDVCTPGYSKSYRDELTKTQKMAVYKAYDVPYDTSRYQIDHFIPISIGGSHDPKNLWPQPVVKNVGFLEKQQVAQYLHEAVCRGDIDLQDAQSMIRRDWHAVWHFMQDQKEKARAAKPKAKKVGK